MDAEFLICLGCLKHYPPGSGLYCPECGKPLVEARPQTPEKSEHTTQRESLERRFLLAGIAYFDSGERLFDLLYILLIIQIVLGLIGLVISCFVVVSGTAGVVSLINSLLRLFSGYP